MHFLKSIFLFQFLLLVDNESGGEVLSSYLTNFVSKRKKFLLGDATNTWKKKRFSDETQMYLK